MPKIRSRTFRLVPYEEYDAETNMAVDEALLELHLQGKTPPTLRFYGWTPPAVSFGYAQKVAPETIARIKKAGYDVVRRPTGGRAVLHEGELTYCFIASSKSETIDFSTAQKLALVEQSDFEPDSQLLYESPYEAILESSVARAYRQICNALINGLTELGVETSLGKSTDGSYKNNEDCFQATTQADLQYEGKKLVGSAQLRRRNGVMQHGSIILNQAQDKMAELLGESDKAASSQALKNGEISSDSAEIDDRKIDATPPPRHFNLRDLLANDVDRTAIEEAIGRGFTKAFDCRFAVYDIKDEEWELVESLKAGGERYRLD
ncbi:MAG: lipoate--protein ligase family protein [Cyanobacteria bacterium REEB67]|nr:lipoate--protein ligase family protein [Cyanobacteria bacterium REEB67]